MTEELKNNYNQAFQHIYNKALLEADVQTLADIITIEKYVKFLEIDFQELEDDLK